MTWTEKGGLGDMNKIGNRVKHIDKLKAAEAFARFKKQEKHLVRMIDRSREADSTAFQAYNNLVTMNSTGRVWSF